MDTPETATVEVTQALDSGGYTVAERDLLNSLGGYQKVFDAIADATSVYAEGVGVNIGVRAFIRSANRHRTRATRQDGLREALAPFAAVCAAFDYWVPEVMPEMRYPVAGTDLANAMIDCPTAIGALTEGDFRRAARALAALSDSSTREERGAGIDLNRFIFEWFNARDPKEMTECIDEYDRRAALSASPEGEG